MLAPPESATGPIRPIAKLLAEGLSGLGDDTTIADWGSGAARPGLSDRSLSRTAQLREVLREIRAEGYDVLVVHTAHDAKALVRDMALLSTLPSTAPPIVLVMHGSGTNAVRRDVSPILRWALRWRALRARVLFVLASPDVEAWSRLDPRIHAIVVRNPYKSGCAPRPPDPRPQTRFAFVGRLLEQKGILVALEAYGSAKTKSDRPTEFHVLGDGPLREQANALAERIGPDVVMHGALSRESVLDVLATCDVLVLPTQSEGFPTAVSEAMDCSLAVITSREGGMPELLHEEVSALFVDPRSVLSVSNAMLRVLADPDLARRMGLANKRLVEQFEPGAVAAEYHRALTDLVHSSP